MDNGHYNFSFNAPSQSYPGGSRPVFGNGGAGPSTLPRPHFSIQRPFMPTAQDQPEPYGQPPPLTGDPAFDILDWHPAYQSCQRFFLDHAQHEQATQALCALVNIRLPFQYLNHPITSSEPSTASQTPAHSSAAAHTFPFPRHANNSASLSPDYRRNGSQQSNIPTFVSLIPYIRRLVVTGFDKPPILHGFFGDDYSRGILPHLDCERRNYLFAAKAGGWRSCKKQYDVGSGMGGDESVPFFKPMDQAKMEELTAAEKAWSSWLAMEDWMIGPLAPSNREEGTRGQEGSNGTEQSDRDMERLPDGVREAFAGD